MAPRSSSNKQYTWYDTTLHLTHQVTDRHAEKRAPDHEYNIKLRAWRRKMYVVTDMHWLLADLQQRRLQQAHSAILQKKLEGERRIVVGLEANHAQVQQ